MTLASLPRTSAVALERDALMGALQYGHAVDAALIDRALTLPMSDPGLDAVRTAVASQPDRTRVGWTSHAVEATREPYRSLTVELLTADFPARTEDAARASTEALARHLLVRAIDREKAQLLAAVQRVDATSEQGRAVRVQLRDLDAKRRELMDAQ